MCQFGANVGHLGLILAPLCSNLGLILERIGAMLADVWGMLRYLGAGFVDPACDKVQMQKTVKTIDLFKVFGCSGGPCGG